MATFRQQNLATLRCGSLFHIPSVYLTFRSTESGKTRRSKVPRPRDKSPLEKTVVLTSVNIRRFWREKT